jgi:hypothetical protein
MVMTHPEQVAKAIVAALTGEATRDLNEIDQPKRLPGGKL